MKVAWSDKQTKQFRVPHPGQEERNKDYMQYLKRDGSEEQQSLLEWLRGHSTVGTKPKALAADKYLVAVKFLSPFNPVFFFQHLLVNHPHRHPGQLRHLEQVTMPPAIQYFKQALSLRPDSWSSPEQLRQQFEHKGHKSSFMTTLVSYVMALHDIHNLCQRRIVDARISCLQVGGAPLPPVIPAEQSTRTSSTAWRSAKPFWTSLPTLLPSSILPGVSTAGSWESPAPANRRCSSELFTRLSSARLQSFLRHRWPSWPRVIVRSSVPTWSVTRCTPPSGSRPRLARLLMSTSL